MPTTPSYLKQPFDKQLEYFRGKIPLPAETLKGITAEYHDWAFSVTGITQADLIRDMQWLIDRAISEGIDFEDFKQQFYRLIGRKGWTPVPIDPNASAETQAKQKQASDRRLYTILDTNHRRSFGAGRHRQMREPNLLKKRPYWQWLWRDSPHPREHHKAIDQHVFLATEEFWEHCFPSCGFGCRCGVRSLSEKDLKRLGLEVSTPPDWRTFIEPGFNLSAGISFKRDREEFIKQGISRQSPQLQAKLKELLKLK